MPHNCQFKRQSMNEYAQLAVHWLTDWMIASQSSLDAWLNIEITGYIAMSIQVKLLPPPIDVNSWSCAGVRSMKSFVLSSKCNGDVMFPASLCISSTSCSDLQAISLAVGLCFAVRQLAGSTWYSVRLAASTSGIYLLKCDAIIPLHLSIVSMRK